MTAAAFAPGQAFGSPGDIDPSFGTNGSVVIDTPQDLSATDIAVAGDGSVYALGFSSAETPARITNTMVLAKLSAAGALDDEFGDGGLVIRPEFIPRDLELSESGDLLVAGLVESGGAGVARFDDSGAVDLAFGGGDGFAETEQSGAIAELANGDILVLESGFALTKLEPSGDPVAEFDSEATDIPDASSTALALLPDGGVAVAGSLWDGEEGQSDVAIAVFNTDGSLRDGFAEDGATIYPGPVDGYIESVASISRHDEKLVIFGSTLTGVFRPGSAGLVASVQPDGTLDSSFSQDGWLMTSFGDPDVDFSSGFVTTDAIVATGGITPVYEPGEVDWPDALFSAVGFDGSPATAFPEGGSFDFDLDDRLNDARASAVAPEGDSFVILGHVSERFPF
ncbi:MAG TPA: hypothetical protein VD766_01595, partial [Solirubrobacterales bacterium]|nr:hypothetical protein [Solirubrobacterales bacterium]